MKKILLILFLSATAIMAQNTSDYKVFYYGDGESKYSDSLQIAVGDSVSGEYYVSNSLIGIAVDSNWTASNIGFMIYNELEEQFEPFNVGDAVLEYEVGPNSPVGLVPAEVAGLKRIKFYKVTSESPVAQATTATKIQVTTIRYN